MKKILFLLMLTTTVAKAQWYSVPDTNFVVWLQQSYPNCMNGNLLDTTCSSVINETNLILDSLEIYNVSGLQYFDSLKIFSCVYNHITNLPKLPIGLTSLNCMWNDIDSLPYLPNSLETLDCSINFNLTFLPSLPNNLVRLSCAGDSINNLPNLPLSLKYLICPTNPISILPNLPNGLIELNCANCELTSLPSLPYSLVRLECSWNLLTSLPTLPPLIEYLSCVYNGLDTINILPNNLKVLSISSNNVQYITNFPNGLKIIDCVYNQLISLPQLPDSLLQLNCAYNQLESLPLLPDSLTFLDCSNNNISCLPHFPNSLIFTNIGNGVSYIFQNPFTCIPNYTSSMDATLLSYPLCLPFDTLNNPNNCDFLGSCFAHYILVADTTTPHNYFAINQSTGAGNLDYVWHWGDNSLDDTIANPTHIYATPGFYNICVTVTDSSGCSNTFCDSSTYISRSSNPIINVSVVSQLPSSIFENIKTNNFTLSPNPTNSTFQISNTQNIKNISIKNILGKEIFQTNNINKSVVDIDITNYSAGVFFVELQSDNATITKKIVKQ